ncbi:MAG: enoyl-CoA hydratase-related protein [Acidimicrobiia bacterium]|nr:enoyl-CoA hydratase-related protein [Acidimicrobiia bacterium]
MSDVVDYRLEADARAAVITMNRPDVRNALDTEMSDALLEAVRRAEADDRARTVVLTGAGDRAFCAGADLDELLRRSPLTETEGASVRRRRLSALLEGMAKPTIAAMNGHAIGGGLELAIACTFRLAVPKAKLGFGEINLGIIPGNGGTQRTVRLIGLGKTLELVLTGIPVDAVEAHRIGLIQRLVEPDELMPEALALAGHLGAKSRRALAAAKEAVLLAGDVPLAAGLAYENKWFAIVNGAPDKAEGIAAFREKREPEFE